MNRVIDTPGQQPAPTGCCPPFNRNEWDKRSVVWRNRPFVREHVLSFFHVPLNIGSKITHAKERIDAAGASTAQPLILSDELSPWRSDLYVDVSKQVQGLEMTTLSGTFLTQVFDGPYRDAPKWVAAMKDYSAQQGYTAQKIYFGYATCPSCAKAYGHNYVVLFARIDAPDADRSVRAQRA